MWQVSHLTTGALVGQKATNPLLAFIFGILIHFVIDKIPHFWPEDKKKRLIYTTIDYIITIFVLVYYIFTVKHNTLNMYLGILASLAVDILLVGFKRVKASKLGAWHEKRQPHKTSWLYLLPDLIVISLSYYLLIK